MSYPPAPNGANPYNQQPMPAAPSQAPGYPSSGPAPWIPPQGGTPSSGRGRKVFGVLMGAFGALLLLGGGMFTVHTYGKTSQKLPNDAYGLTMWRDEPVDKFFPDFLGGRGGDFGDPYDPAEALWFRQGISQDTDCDKGLDGKTLAAAKEQGCKAVLRATYIDATANMVATVAVVVLPDGPADNGPKDKVGEVYSDYRLLEPAVVQYPVPGTLASKPWKRSGAYLWAVNGKQIPYAVGAAIGSVDGHHAGELPGEFGQISGNETDREAWHANAQDLVELYTAHLAHLQMGGLR